MVAVRAIVFRFLLLAESFFQLEERVTDLTSELSSFLSVIVVEVMIGSLTTGAMGMLRDLGRARTVLYRRQWFTMGSLVVSEEGSIVLRGWKRLLQVRRFRKGGQRINREISIMGVLLFEIVFWLYFWITVFENIEKAGNNLLYFVLGELGAYPDDETGYFGHMGLPPVVRTNYIQPHLNGGRQVHIK